MTPDHPDDTPPNADELAQEAQRLVAEGKMEDALPVLARAARVRAAEANPAEGATALLGAARLAILVGARTDATELLTEAGELAKGTDQAAQVLEARIQLATYGGDEAELRAVLDDATRSPDRPTRLMALDKLADLEQRAGRFSEALAALDQLLAARPAPDLERASVLLQRSAVLTLAGNPGTAQDALDEIDRILAQSPDPGTRARVLGQRAVLAAGAGDAERALTIAKEARKEATQGPDPMAYLSASTLIFRLELDAGHEVEAYDALVRARVSLKDLLGPESRTLTDPLFEGMAQKLGPRWDEVRNAWQASKSRS